MTTTSIENHTLERLIDAWDTTVLPKHHDGAMQEWMESLRHEFMTCKQNAMNELTNDQLHDIWLKTSPEEWDFARAVIAADRAQKSARHREELLAYEVTINNLRARLEQAQPERKPMTESEMLEGRERTFSVDNPYCPCDRKTFMKVARYVEAFHGIFGGKP